MTTLLFADPTFAAHQTPPGHPEQSARIDAVMGALSHDRFAALVRRECREASYEAITAAHPGRYVERMTAAVPDEGMIALDPDTHMGKDSWRAARLASGALMDAVDAVADGEADNAFVASRPPGHHAERNRAMGFCLINHVAVAARHAQRAHGMERVAIIDFDVHHGNGTQDIFYDDPSVLYVSTHQSPLYPGTGAASETGAGNILNLPLPPGTDGAAYREVVSEAVLPRLREFAAELLIISAGFDAHRSDPLGGLLLTEDDFSWTTKVLVESARETADGRLVSLLEGGYDLLALGRSAAAHVDVMMGR